MVAGARQEGVGIANWMARILQSTVSIQLYPMTPSHIGNNRAIRNGEWRGRRVIDPDMDPVTFLAVEVLWLLMMPNNLGWKK